MADIRKYEQQVQERPMGQTYHRADGVTADAFGAGVGRALGTLGAGITDIGDALRVSKELTEEAQGLDRFQTSRREGLERMYDPEDGWLSQRGRAAVGTAEAAGKIFEDVREKGRDGLTPRAQQVYDAKMADFADQSYVKVAEHETVQRGAYTEEMFATTIANSLDDAGLNWQDDEWFAQSVQSGIEEVRRFGAFSGRDERATAVAVDNFISNAAKNRILAAATEDPTQIERLMAEHREDLTAKDLHELQTNMKGLIAETKAQALVGGFLRRGYDPTASDPYEQSVIQAESSGDPNARNPQPGATAGGLYGFTDGTYLGTVRDMRSRGQAEWAEGLTDAEITATKHDRKLSKEVFDSFRANNQAVLRRNGFDINPTNEYVIHHFGTGDGPRILRAAQQDPSQTLAEAVGATQANRILKFNPYLNAHPTVGGMTAAISRKMGTDGVTLSGGTHFDAAAAYEAALNIEDPDVRAAAIEQIETLDVTQQKARGQQREDTQRRAWEDYQRTGNMDPGMDARIILGPEGWTSLRGAMTNDQRGVDETDPHTWELLMQTMTEEPKRFMDFNLEDHRAKLSRADMEMFFQQQSEMRAKTAAEPTTEDAVRTLPMAELMKPGSVIYTRFTETFDDKTGAGKKAQAEMARQRMEFDQRLRDMIEEHSRSNGGAQPSETEVQDMARALLTEVVFTPREPSTMIGRAFGFGKDRPGYLFQAATRTDSEQLQLAVDVDDVPFQDRREIEQMWIEEYGETPTPEQIARTHANMNLIAQDLTPVVTIDDVPQAVRSAVEERWAAQNSGEVSEEDIVDYYTLYLLDKALEAGAGDR